MLKKVEGIVLKSIKYSETSVICHIYTLELGLRSYIISGVRKKRSTISPILVQPMALVDLVVYHNEDKDINRIKEIKASYSYQALPFDVAKGAIGLFMTEVAQKAIREPTPHPELFHFLKQSYITLDQSQHKIAYYPSWFLVQFAQHLGFSPSLSSDELDLETVFDYAAGKLIQGDVPVGHHYYFDPQNTQLLAAFLELDATACAKLELETKDRRNFLEDLLRYYRYHLENFGELNALLVLQTVFA